MKRDQPQTSDAAVLGQLLRLPDMPGSDYVRAPLPPAVRDVLRDADRPLLKTLLAEVVYRLEQTRAPQ
ncbi:MAG: hypothetical protein ACLFV3_05945 [Phycisphaeraceae bacterium]